MDFTILIGYILYLYSYKFTVYNLLYFRFQFYYFLKNESAIFLEASCMKGAIQERFLRLWHDIMSASESAGA